MSRKKEERKIKKKKEKDLSDTTKLQLRHH